MSNFFTPEFNNESAIAPWNASLEPTKAIIPQLDANRVLTGGVGEEVNLPTLTPEAYDNIILPDDLLTRMASAVSTDSNSSLPDSSVDLLTGQAMSEVYGDLSKFAAGPDFVAKMNLAFGENWDAAGAKALAEEWFKGDFSDIPQVKVVSSGEIGGANGAFAAATDTIYLSKEFLAGNAANPAAVADVLLEEIGHSVDARLNVTDSPGDEGAIFGAIVQGKELSQGELQGLKAEDDRATVILDEKSISVEQAGNSWKTFVYDFNYKQLGETSLSARRDGINGIQVDWGDGSVNNESRFPRDKFIVGTYNQSYLESNKTYKFRVGSDDGFWLFASRDGKNWTSITPQDNWQLAYLDDRKNYSKYKEYAFNPQASGDYFIWAFMYDTEGAASFDLSWDEGYKKNEGGLNYEIGNNTLQYIYEEMKNNAQSWQTSLIRTAPNKGGALALWFGMTNDNMPWDHKPKLADKFGLKGRVGGKDDYGYPIWGDSQHEYFYDIWSNIHFGYVGKAAGFTDYELQLGSAINDAAKNNNDPNDRNAIALGIQIWNDTNGDPNKLTPEFLRESIIKNGYKLNRFPVINGK